MGTCYSNLAVSFFKGGDVLKTIRTAKNIGLYQHTFALDENSAGLYACKVDTAQMAVFPVMFTLTGVSLLVLCVPLSCLLFLYRNPHMINWSIVLFSVYWFVFSVL